MKAETTVLVKITKLTILISSTMGCAVQRKLIKAFNFRCSALTKA